MGQNGGISRLVDILFLLLLASVAKLISGISNFVFFRWHREHARSSVNKEQELELLPR